MINLNVIKKAMFLPVKDKKLSLKIKIFKNKKQKTLRLHKVYMKKVHEPTNKSENRLFCQH